jgi:beta-xylosidase
MLCGPSAFAEQWNPDFGDGRYKNPIIFADYSDPDVIRVGDDFYLTASSFNCVPGLPILHSRDLVHRRIINYALPRLYDEAFDHTEHGNGVWAPSIRFHDGQFYIYWGDPDRGIYMVRAKDPAGTWSEPVLVKKAVGNIDPCPLWDDDGKAYLVHAFAHSRAGVKSLLQVDQLSPDGTKVIDKGTIVFDGHKNHPTIEGPKFYKRNGYYYIFAPAGGVPTGWQVVLRSKNVKGPYEDRIVLAQGKTGVNGPHQGGYVEQANGECWFIHFQDRGPYGRILHLEPMKWVDDWPVIGDDPDGDGTGQPVLELAAPKVGGSAQTEAPQSGDEFESQSLSLAWQWPANPHDDWYSLTARPGWLQLNRVALPEGGSLWQAPNLLLQKLPAPAFTATTKMDFSKLGKPQRAGLIVFGLDYAAPAGRSDGARHVSFCV